MEELTVTSEHGVHVIKVSGVLERSLSSRMREEAGRLVTEDGAAGLLIDLTDALHIDSMGVGMIVSTFKSCQARNIKFALVGCSDKAGEVLRITRLDSILPNYEDLATARAELGL